MGRKKETKWPCRGLNAETEMPWYIQEVAAWGIKYEESCEGLQNSIYSLQMVAAEIRGFYQAMHYFWDHYFAKHGRKTWKGLIDSAWTICYPKVHWSRPLLSDKLGRMAEREEEETWRNVSIDWKKRKERIHISLWWIIDWTCDGIKGGKMDRECKGTSYWLIRGEADCPILSSYVG